MNVLVVDVGGTHVKLFATGQSEPQKFDSGPTLTAEQTVGGDLEWVGKRKWRRCVADVVARLIAAHEPDDVLLGGGNVKKLKELPRGCRPGDNANAFLGGFRLWEEGEMANLRRRQRLDPDDPMATKGVPR